MSGYWMSVTVKSACALSAVLLAGCATAPSFDTGSGFLGLSLPGQANQKPKTLSEWQQAHREKPRDPETTVGYSRSLKQNGKTREALAVVEAAAATDPNDQKLVVEQGLLALELGQTAKAQHALLRASPDSSDWRVLSGLGVAHAGLGQHANAQKYFEKALAVSPENPTILNNLALSYILDKKVDKGRELLERAAKAGGSKPEIQRNLEMAMALKGGGKPKPGTGAAQTGAPGGPGAWGATTAKPATAKTSDKPALPAADKPAEKAPDKAPDPAPDKPTDQPPSGEPPATAKAPDDKPAASRTASVEFDPSRPKMLNLGGPLGEHR